MSKDVPFRDQCFDCHRKAKWFGPINKVTPPRLLCGYHKKAYTNVIQLMEAKARA